MRVKVVNGDDIRIWRYDKYSYHELTSFIASTWNNIVCDEYIVQYKDEENDLMTIVSTIDLKDAFEFAQSENFKSLKLYIKYKKITKPLQYKPENSSFREMVLDFLSNKEIQKLLVQIFGALIAKIIASNISDLEYKKYAKYIKLRRIKMPKQSIINKMKFDGFTQNEIDIFVQNTFEDKAKNIKKYAKYIKLKKIKMPKQSIMNKMKFDGFSQTEIDSFFEATKQKTKKFKIEEIRNMIYRLIKYSESKYHLIAQHPLYVKYNDILIGYISENIYCQQSLYKHFRFQTLQKWVRRLIDILYQYILQENDADFNVDSIKKIPKKLEIAFPLNTDYGEAIHFESGCNECSDCPIIGERYKCSMCLDVDLCSKCQQSHNPFHPLILFKQSAKAISAKNKSKNNVQCICGQKMKFVSAKSAYNWTDIVFCDGCDKQCALNEIVCHCPNGRDAIHHKQGYDLCINCFSKK